MKSKKKLTAKDWLGCIDRAKKVREDWRKKFRVNLAMDYWEGSQRPPDIPGNEWITINMIYSNLQAELPTLYNSDPYYYVKLKKARSTNPMEIALLEQKAKVRQSFLNYLKGELNLKKKARLAIFDAFFQYGVVKTHFSADEIENPDAGKSIYLEDTEIPLIGENNQPLMEPDTLPANEKYKITRIHPDDFLVDEDAGPLDPDDVGWKAQRIRVPLEEAKKNPKYKSNARKLLQATELSDEAQQDREKRKKGGLAIAGKDDIEPDIAILWEIYDLKNDQWLVVAENCKEFLKDPDSLPPGMEGDPFVDLRYTIRDDSWYPLPPVSQWLDPQREYCETRSKRLQHRKKSKRVYELYGPAFDDPEAAAARLESGEDLSVLIKNQVMPAIIAVPDAPLDHQEHLEYSYLRQDFQDLAVGPNQRGSTAGVDSATEAGILEKRAMVREGDKIGIVMDFLTLIARKMDQLVQANITEDQAIKVAGPAGDEVWELIRATDYTEIAGEYDYSINVGAETPQLPEIERAQLLAALGVFAQAPQLLLVRNLTKKILELHHIYDETIVDDLKKMAEAMMSGQIPMPGQQGSQPNVTQRNPAAITGGAAMGMANIRGGQQ